jgi:hypothetical protein
MLVMLQVGFIVPPFHFLSPKVYMAQKDTRRPLVHYVSKFDKKDVFTYVHLSMTPLSLLYSLKTKKKST